jgi:hypothetical protein
VLYICKLSRCLVSWCDSDSVRIMYVFLVNVPMNCWYLLEPSSAFTVIVWDNLVWGNTNFEECFVALCMISVRFSLENYFELHIDDSIYWFNYVIFVGSVSTSESMIPRPCFRALHTVYIQFCYMFARSDIYFRLHLLLIIITTTCIADTPKSNSTVVILPLAHSQLFAGDKQLSPAYSPFIRQRYGWGATKAGKTHRNIYPRRI